MAVPEQQIAEPAGGSRGTVDRALHNRGRVSPEVAARRQKIAEELGYRPNSIGQALVRARQDIRLGAILQSAETPTMQDVAAGARQAAEELRDSGLEVELREVQGRDTAKVLRRIDELLDWGAGGLDIAAAQGVKVLSISAGTVDQVYKDGLMGTTVVVDHGGGLQSWYCNLDEDVLVEAGDPGDIGGELGTVGASAIAEVGVASHVHLETILDGQPVDPREYLK